MPKTDESSGHLSWPDVKATYGCAHARNGGETNPRSTSIFCNILPLMERDEEATWYVTFDVE